MGSQRKTLKQRYEQRLKELDYKPWAKDAPNQPNTCVDFVISGDHDRMTEIAFGKPMDLDWQEDNGNATLADDPNCRGRKQIETMALDYYDFLCQKFGEVNVIAGGWTEASRFLEGRRAAAKAAADAEKAKAAAEEAASRQSEAPSGPKKLSYNEKRELESLPDRIEALEKEVAEIESAMSDGSMFARDPKKAADMARRLPEAKAELESAVDRWAELSERA